MSSARFLPTLCLLPALAAAHGGNPRVEAIHFPVDRPGEAWISVDNRGLYLHRDGALTWMCDEAVVPAPGFTGMAPVAGALLATGTSGLRLSAADGCGFDAVAGPLAPHATAFLRVHPERPAEILVATRTIGLPNDVFFSDDGGLTWRGAGLEVGGRVQSLLRSAVAAERVFVAHADGLALSDDGGRSFVALPLPADPDGEGEVSGAELRLLATHPTRAETVFAVLERFPDSTVLRSDDAGQSWSVVVALPDTPASMAIERAGTRMLLATPFEGLYRSVDGGASWAPVANPEPDLFLGCLSVEPGSDRVWACARGDLVSASWVVGHTADWGETWTVAMPGLVTEAARWPCPDGTPTTATCARVCRPEDPACAQIVDAGPLDAAVDATVDAGPRDARPADAAPGDDGARASGCRSTAPSSPLLLLLVAARVRRRRAACRGRPTPD